MKRFIQNTTIVLCVILLTLGIAEITFRIFKKNYLPLAVLTQHHTGYLFKPHTSLPLTSSVEGEFNEIAHINNLGYRGNDFELTKKNGVPRILMIGDSFTFGVGCTDDETIAACLQKDLAQQHINAQVINAGVGHTGPLVQYLNLKTIHLKLEPDLVILLFDFTDLADDWKAEQHAVYDTNGDITRIDYRYLNGKLDVWQSCMYYSSLCMYLNNKVVRTIGKIRALGLKNFIVAKMQRKKAKAVIANSDTTEDTIAFDGLLMMRGTKKAAVISKHWQRTAAYLTKIKALLDSRHIPFIIVTYPHGIYVGNTEWNNGRVFWGFEQNTTYTDYYPFELVETYARANNITYINTLPDFLQSKINADTKLFYDYDGHMTPAGYAIVAESITANNTFNHILATINNQL